MLRRVVGIESGLASRKRFLLIGMYAALDLGYTIQKGTIMGLPQLSELPPLQIRFVSKDDNGVIERVGGYMDNRRNEQFWSYGVDDAVNWIEAGVRFYVHGVTTTGQVTEVPVIVVEGQTGKYIRTKADGSLFSNLDDLPPFP